MRVFSLEELQKMNENELITIIGNYISDQEIWINQVKALEKQVNEKDVEIEQLKKRHGVALLRNDDLDLENYELKKQVDELKKKIDKEYERGYYFGKQDALTSDRKEDCTVQSETSAYDKAVKDTAKGIYKEIGKGDILVVQTQEYGEIEVVSMDRLKEIIKQKGVEVE